jgi:hypothetical protein
MTGKIKTSILCVIMLAVGFLLGNIIGKDSGYQAQAALQRLKSMNELRADLKQAESNNILDLLNVSAEVKQVDEGGLFKTKIVTYLHGKLTNSAAVATAKDIKLKIEFLSKTGAVVGADELAVYEFIQPNHEHTWKQKIAWPDAAQKYKLSLVAAHVH